mgnify:FL=1
MPDQLKQLLGQAFRFYSPYHMRTNLSSCFIFVCKRFNDTVYFNTPLYTNQTNSIHYY